MGEYLKDTPEFVELELGESLVSRTETLGQSLPSTPHSAVATAVLPLDRGVVAAREAQGERGDGGDPR